MAGSPPNPPPPDALASALAFLRRTIELTAQQIEVLDGVGMIIRTPNMPAEWPVNQLRVLHPITFAQAIELAETRLDGLPYRHVFVEHEPTGIRLEEQFLREGWRVERDLLMALARATDRSGACDRVTELDEQAAARLMARWHAEEHPDAPADQLEQVARFAVREGKAWSERRFGIVYDGEPVAMTKLRSDGRTAQVEDVYTAREYRGRGYARALVTHAINAARADGHDLTFIVADDANWPKTLYGKLGFDPLARVFSFRRARSALS